MAERVAIALRELRERSVYSRHRDLVFCHPETGKPLDRSKLVRRFKQAIDRAGVHRITFHELRHTFGTRMAAAGTPMRTLQHWMGHAESKTTQIYAHYGEIDQLVTRLSESVHTMASGERRIGKTTICDAACARLRPELETVRIEVPERRDADTRAFLPLIIDRCNTISHAAATRKLLRAARPAIETVLGSAGIPLNLDELGAEPPAATAREILALPRSLADELDKQMVFFLDELQRAVDYTDGAEILQALVDVYSGGGGDVVGLVDGSDDRLLDRMRDAPIQFDTLCDRLAITASIPRQVWRETLPGRFEQLSITIEPAAIEAILEFGEERPYATMAAAQGAALAARRINVGTGHATVGAFEADQGIEFARRRLADDV